MTLSEAIEAGTVPIFATACSVAESNPAVHLTSEQWRQMQVELKPYPRHYGSGFVMGKPIRIGKEGLTLPAKTATA